jgi:kynurenine aminotransferase
MTAPVSSFTDRQSTQPNGTTTTSVSASTNAPAAASNGLASITKSAAKTTALGKANIKQSSKLVAGNADKLDVWSIFTPANMPPDAINLGQGFMNWKPPQWVRDASQKAMNDDVMSNHYSHPRGRPRLLNAISKHYSPQFQNLVEEGRQLKPEEIVVTAGANEGMFAALLAFLEQDDEVICIEPFFDQYLASIIFNGGKPVYVPLHPPQATEGKTKGSDWKLDLEEFEKAFTPKTKVVIVNTPHNPSGKCFTREELTGLAEICTRHNVLVLADEVVRPWFESSNSFLTPFHSNSTTV